MTREKTPALTTAEILADLRSFPSKRSEGRE